MFYEKDGTLIFERKGETVQIFAQGTNALRVRATMNAEFDGTDWALAGAGKGNAVISIGESDASIANGKISATVTRLGQVRFFKDGKPLLQEYYRCYEYEMPHTPSLRILAREFKPIRGGDYAFTLRFESCDGEKIFGMGQYQQPYLDLKGCTLELAQRNSQISVPFALSSLGYGFLWNNPAVGNVTFGKNVTEWHAESIRQCDYWITADDTPKAIMKNYTDLVGRAPEFPENAMGLWQCKLRYRTQEEVLEVAREYHRRGVPLDVIVIDFFHWTRQGDWKFDPKYWPDPAAMVRELKSYGVELSCKEDVSVVCAGFDTTLTYEKLDRAVHFLRRGAAFVAANPDWVCPMPAGEVLPDCGSICALLTAASGVKPFFIGKPNRSMVDIISEMTGVPNSQICCVGDRLYTDIAVAVNAGAQSVLVMSGETTLEMLAESEIKPGYVFADVAALAGALDIM